QTQHGQEGGHEHRAQTDQRALHHGLEDGQAGIAELVEITDHDHAVQHGLPEQGNEANRGRDPQGNAGKEQRQNAADEGERHIQQDQQRALNRFERVKKQHKNQENAHRHDDGQALHGPLLVFKLAAPGDEVTRRAIDGRFDFLLHFLHQAAHVASANEDGDGLDAHAELAADVHAAAAGTEGGNLFQRDVKAARGVHEDLSNVGQFAFSFLEPHDHAEMFLSFPQFGGGPAAKSGLNHVLDVQYVKPIAGGAGPIDFDLQLRYLAAAVNKSPRHSSHWGNGVQDPFRLLLQDAAVLAKHFDHNLPVDLEA